MPSRPLATDDQIRNAFRRTDGQVKAAAKELGISRQALHERLARKPALRTGAQREEPTNADILMAMQTLEVCLGSGEFWALKWVVDRSEPTEPRKLPWRPRYSDQEIENLIRVAGGDLRIYRDLRARLAHEQVCHSLASRRIIIEVAAAVALNIRPAQVWGRLKSAWVELQFLKKVLSRESSKEPASKRGGHICK